MRVATGVDSRLVMESLVGFAEQVGKHLDWYRVGLDAEGAFAENVAESLRVLKAALGEAGV